MIAMQTEPDLRPDSMQSATNVQTCQTSPTSDGHASELIVDSPERCRGDTRFGPQKLSLREYLRSRCRILDGVTECAPRHRRPVSGGAGLTERQREIFVWICAFMESRGYAPTLREIGCRFGIGSTNGVNDHLRAIERKGYLERDAKSPRAMRLTKQGRDFAFALKGEQR